MNSDSHAIQKPVPASRAGAILAFVGAWLQAGPFVGLFGSVLEMIQAFRELGSAPVGDPGMLAKSIGEALISFASGLVLSLVGTALLILAMMFYNYRERWVRMLLTVVGIAWLIMIVLVGGSFLFGQSGVDAPANSFR